MNLWTLMTLGGVGFAIYSLIVDNIFVPTFFRVRGPKGIGRMIRTAPGRA